MIYHGSRKLPKEGITPEQFDQTEETWTGAQVEGDVPTATALLGAGLEQWLRGLKATAEARSGEPCT